jgi:hypothetical protein
LSGLIAAKRHDRRIAVFALLYPLLALGSFRKPPGFPFGISLAFPLFRLSLSRIDFLKGRFRSCYLLDRRGWRNDSRRRRLRRLRRLG